MNRPNVTLQLARYVTTAAPPSQRVLQVAAMFGLGVDEERCEQIIPPTTLTLRPGQVVFINGPSGSGKSMLLRLIEEAATTDDRLTLISASPNTTSAHDSRDDEPLIEQIGTTLEEGASYLASAGLGDAFVMLRRPRELSDGQCYRWRLAQAMEKVAAVGKGVLPVVAADEFAAALDRQTARTIARNVRRFATKSRLCFIAATTHDDILEALDPDVLVYKPLGECIEVVERS